MIDTGNLNRVWENFQGAKRSFILSGNDNTASGRNVGVLLRERKQTDVGRPTGQENCRMMLKRCHKLCNPKFCFRMSVSITSAQPTI